MTVWLAVSMAVVACQWWLLGVRARGLPSVTGGATVEVGPIGGPVTLTQTFKVDQAGLKGVALRLRPAQAVDDDASVVLELAEVRASAVSTPAYRIVRRMSDVATGRRHWWTFAPLRDSAGKTYQLRLSVPNILAERGVLVRATQDERYRDGVLAIDGRELWGDVLLEADATDATLLARTMATVHGWPPWVTWAFLCSSAALSGALTVVVLRQVSTVSPPRSDAVAEPRAVLAGVGALVVLAAGAALVQWTRQPAEGGRETGAVQLLDRFDEATKRTSMAHLQDAFHRETVILNETWTCLMALPSTRVTWRQAVAAPGRLRLSYGLRPDVWHGPGDGAVFRVGIGHRGTYRDAVKTWLSPAERDADRGLKAFELDLSPYVGDDVDIVLNTEPGPSGNAVGDAALWCAPRIVAGAS